MKLLVEGQRSFLDATESPVLGRFIGVRPAWGIPSAEYVEWLDRKDWGADNGAFAGFEPAKFSAFLERLSESHSNCRFVVSPDVVADMEGTLKLFENWGPIIRKDFPVALALQNGVNGHLPWDEFDALFLGGDTAFKLSSKVAEKIIEAKDRGKWVHIGRVNQNRRIRHFKAIGADSFDGSGFSQNIRHIKRAIRLLSDQQQEQLQP